MPDVRLIFSKSLRVWGVLLISLAACTPAATPTPTAIPTSIPTSTPLPSATAEWERPGWTLVWQDEFSGETIDPANWQFETGGGGWGNNESEYYTSRPENARIEQGNLVIEARKEYYKGKNYTSARLKTQNLQAWAYGRIEARMQLPYGQGLWPAFWMLGTDIYQSGWPLCGEIDIMEFIGRDPAHAYGTVHGPGYSGAGGVGSPVSVSPGSLSESFHTYAIEWDPEEIRWYLDDAQYFRVTPGMVSGKWVYDHPFFILLNLAVGGNWPGYPDETTIFPQFLRVDYVRVYQQPGLAAQNPGQPAAIHLGRIDLDYQENPDGTWQAVATITVVDQNGNPVEGAHVRGGWVGLVVYGENEADTGPDGTIRLASKPTSQTGEITFCVTNITHARYTYDKTANQSSCGKVTH
jgi:beta-glucanase (GH16 family)